MNRKTPLRYSLFIAAAAASALAFGEYRFSADFAVVSRSDDKVVVRTTCQKDAALFFRLPAR